MDGILNVNKPEGWTSHDVVAKARGILRTKRIGHSGTLDPPATGVLLLCIGAATRVTDYLVDSEKEYVVRAVFGESTDTQDAVGRVLTSADASGLTREAVESELVGFRGKLKQTPPMVSAVHHNGRRLYELARQNLVVEREARDIEVSEFELLDFQPGERARASFRIVCSKGTYVRTLCHDLGEKLGVGGRLEGLVRTRVGRFRVEDSITMDELQTLAAEGRVGEKMIAIPDALSHVPSRCVSDDDALAMSHGNRVALPDASDLPEDGEMLILAGDGSLIALAKVIRDGSGAALQPTKVFASPESLEVRS